MQKIIEQIIRADLQIEAGGRGLDSASIARAAAAIVEAVKAAAPMHTAVIFPTPEMGLKHEVLINGEPRPDLRKTLIYKPGGSAGYVIHPVTYDELCNITVRKTQ